MVLTYFLTLCLLAVKIGRPGYRVTKQFDSDTKQRSLLFQVLFDCFLLCEGLFLRNCVFLIINGKWILIDEIVVNY